jgi:hypothetical protein
MKRAGKARLRGEMRVEGYLSERQLARGQFRHRILEPQPAYITVRRDAHGERELPRKMKPAVACDSCEIHEREVILDVCRDIVENAAEPNMIDTLGG